MILIWMSVEYYYQVKYYSILIDEIFIEHYAVSFFDFTSLRNTLLF